MPRLLIVAMLDWFGPARIVHPLAAAGFDVYVIAGPQYLVRQSRYIRGGFDLSGPDADRAVAPFRHAIATSEADLILPGDENSARFLQLQMPSVQTYARSRGREIAVGGVRNDPAALFNKSRQGTFAASIGIRTPRQASPRDLTSAMEFASSLDYRVAVKLDGSYAGSGVTLTTSKKECIECFEMTFEDANPTRNDITIQEIIDGPLAMHMFVAFEGRYLEGFSMERVRANPEPLGPSSVVRFVDDNEVVDFAKSFVQALGYTGYAAIDYIANEGKCYMIELNARVVPQSHLGSLIDRDLALALYKQLEPAAATGSVGPIAFTRDIALFPQELLRDRASAYIRDGYHDVPWHEPGLVNAIVGKL